jgi:hypothetical protein
MKITQSKNELKTHLIEQIGFLNTSSHLYDLGFENEGKRLAVTLRVLLSDSKNSTSLLSALELKDKLFFYDWIKELDKKEVFRSMTGITGTPSGIKFIPTNAFNSYEKVTFEKWWNRVIIYDKHAQISFDRSEIIRSVADMDGGAHVDSKMKESYYKLSRNQLLGWSDGKGGKPINSPSLALIRQFVYEINKSFEDQRNIWETQ